MLNVFRIEDNRLVKVEVADVSSQSVPADWIDLVDPALQERRRVQEIFDQALASEPELDDIEASARFFEDEDGLHIHSFFFYGNNDNHIVNTTVAFTLRSERLFTLREHELATFRLYLARVNSRKITTSSPCEILIGLFDTKIEQLADEIETIYSRLDDLSRLIMRGTPEEGYDEGLSRLAELEDLSSKIRLCLMDSQRALNFLIRRGGLSHYELEQTREIVRDIESLLPHNEAVFQKINFLLQAAMGFINMEQNKIIKIFSVVSVVFLPPTLVASSYGMNFHSMPELSWTYGYPIAIVVMIIVAIAPYFYFKRRKWL